MKINKLTITGADDATNQDLLLDFSNNYGFVEWGILFSKTKLGEKRYPTLEYINTLPKELNLSAHFCGWWAKEVLENKNYHLINELAPNFKRVQLNYNFKHSTGYKLFSLLTYLYEHPDRSVILQYNKSNSEELDRLLQEDLPQNLHFLYDSSGGRGKVIERIDTSLGSAYTGFSGGLNPDNMATICTMVVEDAEEVDVWLDLETGVRTEDIFDLDKVKSVLETTHKFI